MEQEGCRMEAADFAEALGCACFTLRKTARAVTQFYNAALQPSGLLATQFSLLAVLAGQGSASMTALAERLGMDRTTLTRNLQALERRGLAVVHPDAEDGRVQRIAITEAGQDALEGAWPLWRGAQAAILGQLGAGRWAEMARDLAEVEATSRRQ
jgi:DNA-binding MarR family transcriptional regulator